MDAIVRLRKLGYRVRAEEDRIKVKWTGPGDAPDVTPLLDQLRDRKAEALDLLRQEASQPKPWTYTSPDPDRSGHYIARRPGSSLQGRGATELDACLSLWDQEEALERERSRT